MEMLISPLSAESCEFSWLWECEDGSRLAGYFCEVSWKSGTLLKMKQKVAADSLNITFLKTPQAPISNLGQIACRDWIKS